MRRSDRSVKSSVLMGLLSVALQPSAWAAAGATAPVPVDPGGVVRWAAPGTKTCGMLGRSWAALQDACYYPVDLLQKPGVIEVARWGAGAAEVARISVNRYPYPTQEVDLGAIPQAEPSPADQKRIWRDQAVLDKVWKRKTARRFELPLGKPAEPLPAPGDFGSRRVFNSKPASQPHTGADYLIPSGAPLKAVAAGTVVVAEEQFFPGNAVFIDHGDGLISMYFHLAEFKVEPGQEVKQGDVIGTVGSNGRSTGPHLHLGLRWRNARINPQLLLDDPAKLPSITR
jgi:biotin carboxyl carrier protein